ncbi:uncharacterized protein LOC106013548, partial [Aplysia californica]|uniref:Uncharacterized protein LOC106013548 n=1 Tax=Aplysia californica TaxID=6500 RepID=A0ABM1ACD5_APLCA
MVSEMAVLALLALTVSHVHAHLCILNPPQRLRNPDTLYVSCYQQEPPCGRMFPQVPDSNMAKLVSGSEFSVDLYLPITHYQKSSKTKIEIFMAKTGTNNYNKISEQMGGPETYQQINVTLPSENGKYLLQAVYKPPGYTFFSCADVELTSDKATARPYSTAPTPHDDGSTGIVVNENNDDNVILINTSGTTTSSSNSYTQSNNEMKPSNNDI